MKRFFKVQQISRSEESPQVESILEAAAVQKESSWVVDLNFASRY